MMTDTANQIAFERLTQAEPILIDVKPAIEVVPAAQGHEVGQIRGRPIAMPPGRAALDDRGSHLRLVLHVVEREPALAPTGFRVHLRSHAPAVQLDDPSPELRVNRVPPEAHRRRAAIRSTRFRRFTSS